MLILCDSGCRPIETESPNRLGSAFVGGQGHGSRGQRHTPDFGKAGVLKSEGYPDTNSLIRQGGNEVKLLDCSDVLGFETCLDHMRLKRAVRELG
jgi:hypothetical protein